ncbi:hypothetical protein LINGRAPRIM_LOCUS3408 [Linum grandiflorum]
MDALMIRVLDVDEMCPGCYSENESISHHLFMCPVSRLLARSLGCDFLIASTRHPTVLWRSVYDFLISSIMSYVIDRIR